MNLLYVGHSDSWVVIVWIVNTSLCPWLLTRLPIVHHWLLLLLLRLHAKLLLLWLLHPVHSHLIIHVILGLLHGIVSAVAHLWLLLRLVHHGLLLAVHTHRLLLGLSHHVATWLLLHSHDRLLLEHAKRVLRHHLHLLLCHHHRLLVLRCSDGSRLSSRCCWRCRGCSSLILRQLFCSYSTLSKFGHEGVAEFLPHATLEIEVDVDSACHLAFEQNLDRFLFNFASCNTLEEKYSLTNQVMLLDRLLIIHCQF